MVLYEKIKRARWVVSFTYTVVYVPPAPSVSVYPIPKQTALQGDVRADSANFRTSIKPRPWFQPYLVYHVEAHQEVRPNIKSSCTAVAAKGHRDYDLSWSYTVEIPDFVKKIFSASAVTIYLQFSMAESNERTMDANHPNLVYTLDYGEFMDGVIESYAAPFATTTNEGVFKGFHANHIGTFKQLTAGKKAYLRIGVVNGYLPPDSGMDASHYSRCSVLMESNAMSYQMKADRDVDCLKRLDEDDGHPSWGDFEYIPDLAA